MANEHVFAGSAITIGGVTVAKVTSVRDALTMQEIDITGAEDVSGILVQEQFLPVSIGESIDIEYVLVGDPTPATSGYEPGQDDIQVAARSGASVTIKALKPDLTGWTYVGFITALGEQGAVKDVYKGSCTVRVNSATQELAP